jgi:DNA primase large subunit
MLFRLRCNNDDASERSDFVSSLKLEWLDPVPEEDKIKYASELAAMTTGKKNVEDDSWFKVDWERVPDLVEGRRVFMKAGKAYVPGREQLSMIVGEFSSRLERQLEVSMPV